MTKTPNTTSFNLISLIGIVAIMLAFLLINTLTAHGCANGESCYGYGGQGASYYSNDHYDRSPSNSNSYDHSNSYNHAEYTRAHTVAYNYNNYSNHRDGDYDRYGYGYGYNNNNYNSYNYYNNYQSPAYYPPVDNTYGYQPITYAQPAQYYVQPTQYYVQPTQYYTQPVQTYVQPTQTVSYQSSLPYSNISYVANQTNSNNGLDVGCYSDPTSSVINQPVTWNVEVSGGIAPYTYSWTGSEGLTGNQSSIIKYYATNGQKNAIVTVKSSDGLTTTHACANTLTVGSIRTYSGNTTTTSTNTSNTATSSQANNSTLSASSASAFGNIPWGWITILIILVLFFAVIYLLLNRNKI